MFFSCGQKDYYYEDEVLQVVEIEAKQSSAGNYISLIKVSIKNNSDDSLVLLCPIFNCYDEKGEKILTTTRDDVIGETSISKNQKGVYKIALTQKNIQKVELKEIIYEIHDISNNKDITKKIDIIGNLKKQKKEMEEEQKKKAQEEKEKQNENKKEEGNNSSTSDKDSNSLSEDRLFSYKDYAEQCVNLVLKSPSTAEYPGSFFNPFEGWSITKKGDVVTIESYVDSQNSFGAVVRAYFVIKIKDEDNAKAFYMKVDDTVYIDN